MAELARDEESWWQSEISRAASAVIFRGRPVRGGGRASTSAEGIAIDISRLIAEPAALQRRILRHAANQLESTPDFIATESLRAFALTGKASQKLELANGLRAERTHRELRLTRSPATAEGTAAFEVPRYECVVPGVLEAPAFGCRIHLDFQPASSYSASAGPTAVLRAWKPGDRVHLRYSSGPRKIKEVLERLKVTGQDRTNWPVLDVEGRILWMRGAELEPDPAICITSEPLFGPDAADDSFDARRS